MRKTLGAIFLAVLAIPAIAGIQKLEVGGFSFELEVTVPATPERTFDAFTRETLEWWDHHFSEKPVGLYFETKPGGGFLEIFDEEGNGARHATVIYADRGKMLRFTGPLGMSGHALEMVHTLTFEPVKGGTRVALTVRGSGQLEQGWPEAVEGVWRHFLVERFKPHVEATAE